MQYLAYDIQISEARKVKKNGGKHEQITLKLAVYYKKWYKLVPR